MSQYFPSLIPYRSGQKWGYTDRDKNIRVDLSYDQTFPFVGAIARVIKDGHSGIIDRAGREILPVKYEEAGSILTGTFLNDNGTCPIYHDGKYGLVSVHGALLADVIFDSEEAAMNHAAQQGWRGAVPTSHLPDMPSEVSNQLEAIKPFQNDVAPFKKEDRWGLITKKGKVLCEPRYDEIEAAENGYWPFRLADKWGLLDSEGDVAITAKFGQIRGFSNGQAACKQGEYWGAVNTSGEWMIEPQYSELGELKDGRVAAQKDGLYGFVDEKGQTMIDFRFQNVMDFDEKVCCVFEGDSIYFIDTRGSKISESYQRIFGPNEEGLIHVMSEDKWGLIQTNGQFLLPIQYDLPRAMGQVIQTIEEDRIPIKKGPFLGYANKEGKEIVAPKYMVIDAYCEGMSLVAVPDDRLNFGKTAEEIEQTGSISGVFHYGFIDLEGKEVVPPKYHLARRFEFGLAFVHTDDGAGYITYDGTEYFDRG